MKSSRDDLNRARMEILSILPYRGVMPKPLIASLKKKEISEAVAQAAIWDLVDRREVQFTRDWKLLPAGIEHVAVAAAKQSSTAE